MQQIEGLDRDAGLGPCSLHCALNSPSEDVAGHCSAPLYVFLTPGHVALALTCHMFPVLVIGGVGS